MNLRHFIFASEDDEKLALKLNDDSAVRVEDDGGIEEDVGKGEADTLKETKYYYLSPSAHRAPGQWQEDEKQELTRIPTCAVFHKVAQGRGVPHSFIGEIS